MYTPTVALGAFLAASALALPHPADVEKRTTFPFTRMVAFGDNLSDNGNGTIPSFPRTSPNHTRQS